MQLTERFKLSKIESGDPFLPNDLNNGTGQVEEALRIAHMGAVEEHQKQEALEQRVTALEVQKIFFGTVVATGQEQTVNLGFTPVALIFVDRQMGFNSVLAVGDCSVSYYMDGTGPVLELVENGFRFRSASSHFNEKDRCYNYVAFV